MSLVIDTDNRGWMRRQRPKLFFVMLFAWPLAGLYFHDFATTYPRAGWELKSGQVIMREMGTTVPGIKRPLLTVRTDGSGIVVHASLASNGIADLPARVTFYYSGDPAREVLLQEETNPVWIGVFLLAGPVAGLWLINRFLTKPRTKAAL